MDLSTRYLGFTLKNPLVCAASPLTHDIDTAKRLEDAGVSALVMYSLFEEQITHEQNELDHFLNVGTESFAEALSYFPEPEDYANVEAEDYLKHLSKLKEAVDIPVIGSLNGISRGGWIDWGKKMEDAGADALELNVYYIPTHLSLTSKDVEDVYTDDLKAAKEAVNIPVSMKLGSTFTSFAQVAQRLDQTGADGLVMFNRFFGPDIDLEKMEVVPKLRLSDRSEMQLPLRWIAMLHGTVDCSLAATSGIHTSKDIIKMVLAGADIVQIATILLIKGVKHATTLLDEVQLWMEEHEYNSLSEMRGSMSYQNIAEPAAYERANYMKQLQSYDGAGEV